MKKLALASAFTFASLTFAVAPAARACDGDKSCDCEHAQAAKAKGGGKLQKVALEGKVITYGCQISAAEKQCTGAALVVGETKHMIKKSKKGSALAKARDTEKTFKVTGSTQGEFLTVDQFEPKG
jgi:hypothetical protein